MAHPAPPLQLRTEDRLLLEDKVRSRRTPERIRQRCQIILLGADGTANAAIAEQLKVDRTTVQEWRRRFRQGQVGVLFEDPKGADPRVQVLAQWLDQALPEGGTAWTVRGLAEAVGYSPATVQRLLSRAGLAMNARGQAGQPRPGHEAWLPGLMDLRGFYLHAPYHALLFEVDTDRFGLPRPEATSPLRPGDPAWILHLHLRTIDGLRNLDGCSTHYSSTFWTYLSDQVRPKTGRQLWCVTDTPVEPWWLAELQAMMPFLRIQRVEPGKAWADLVKGTLIPALHSRSSLTACQSLVAASVALEGFLRAGATDPLRWSAVPSPAKSGS